MTSRTPVAAVTLSAPGAVTTVAVGAKCTVTYEFNTTATKGDLALPYAVAINGRVLPEYNHAPKLLSKTDRTINVTVEPGSEVALFLNSDAHPDHRKNPVYAARVGNNDVKVKIKEKKGRISHEWPTLRDPLIKSTATPGKRLEVYEAALTGDIWMRISHPYSLDEAERILPANTDPIVRTAVCTIYTGMSASRLVVKFPANGSRPSLTVTVQFMPEMDKDARENITTCKLLTDVLPRVHPLAYTALLTEAYATGLTEVRITSAWRPCKGSIAHRAGLGLDINYATNGSEKLIFNREWLTEPKGRRNSNVSELEKTLYGDYQKAKQLEDARKQEAAIVKKKLQNVKKGAKEEAGQKEALEQADERVDAAREIRKQAEVKWHAERDRTEPAPVRTFRDNLSKNPFVVQLLDPWYIDYQTKDELPPVPNQQLNQTETGHNNHLHITVIEPKILP